MDAPRALAALQGLALGAPTTLSAGEEDELAGLGCLTVLDAGAFESLRASAATLLARQADARRAASSGGLASPEARERMRAAALALEEAARSQARAAAFRPNPPTGHSLAVSETGRQAIADLTAWQARLAGVELEPALQWLDGVRQRFRGDVFRAGQELQDMSSRFLTLDRLRQDFGPAISGARRLTANDLDPAQRSAALIFAMGNVAVGTLSLTAPAAAGVRVLHDPRRSPSLIVAAALVAVSQANDPQAIGYPALVREVDARFPGRLDAPLLAASLADLSGNAFTEFLDRLDRVRAGVFGTDPYILLTIARSTQPLEVLAARYGAAFAALVPPGSPAVEEAALAAAILASSELPIDDLVARFTALYGWIGPTLHSPMIAAATLATGAFAPTEAWFLLREGCAAISRGGYFDTVLEIDKLGFLLVDHYTPPPFGVPGPGHRVLPLDRPGPGAPGPVPGATPLLGAVAGGLAIGAGFLWVARYAAFLDAPVVVDVLAHPEHAHTVAGFG